MLYPRPAIGLQSSLTKNTGFTALVPHFNNQASVETIAIVSKSHPCQHFRHSPIIPALSAEVESEIDAGTWNCDPIRQTDQDIAQAETLYQLELQGLSHAVPKGFGKLEKAKVKRKRQQQTETLTVPSRENGLDIGLRSSTLHPFEEFRSSAIPDPLTQINVEWVEGDLVVEILAEDAIAKAQKVSNYITNPGQRILDRYEFAKLGGWIAYGTTLDGGQGAVAYFKAKNPRIDFEKRKPIKYETPAGCEALPILSWVDDATAQTIYQRYGVEPLEGEAFWQTVKRHNLPVAVVEGLKKALALIAHGIPAIALRGITCWHKKGSLELHEALAHFATSGRTIYIVFDQDEKPKTQRDVRTQALKLGAVLEASGCKVIVPCWSSSEGKGIDDALFAKGKNAAQKWLDELLKNSSSLNGYKRNGRIAAALDEIARLNQLSYPAERGTEGEYLPDLPELQQGAIHVVSASMNSGKTHRIGRDWVKEAITLGWNVLVLSPLNSLGQQTAQDWELPHIHHFGTSVEQQKALWATVSAAHGLVCCPDSLHRLPKWFFDRPLLLVLDEGNQVIDHICQGNTLGSRWSDVLEQFTKISRHAIRTGAIALSEDGLPDRAVDLVKSLSEAETVRVFKHRKQGIPWNCRLFQGQASGYRARLLQSVKAGQRILIVTSSQREAKRLERAIAQVSPGSKVIRIDSETNEGGVFNAFFDSPDTWLEANQPDVLILSPSAKSGVSIQGNVSAENAYFSEVWGYFPALATDTHMQLLGRYRPSVPRFIYCPPFILGSGDEGLLNPRAIQRRLQLNGKALAGIYGLSKVLEANDQRDESTLTVEEAVMIYLAAATAVAGCQKSIAFDALMNRLEQAGHQVTVEKVGKDKETADHWKAIQVEIWRKDAAAIAGSVINSSEHTPDWARKTLNSLEASLESRILARKVLWREEFPGVDFDDTEDCYQALCQNYGSMVRGVQLQARAENLEASKESDRAATEFILQGKIRAFHRLPKSYVRSLLIAKTGVLALLDGEQYSNSDPRAIAVKREALKWANEIRYCFRLDIKPEQTPVEIAHKLLRKLGLEINRDDRPGAVQMIARPGKRSEKRDQIYRVDLSYSSVRVRLLKAAQRKLSESVSSLCNKDQEPHIQINVPTSPPPPDLKVGAFVRWGSRLGSWVIVSVEGAIAKVRQVSDYASQWMQDAPLSELRVLEAA